MGAENIAVKRSFLAHPEIDLRIDELEFKAGFETELGEMGIVVISLAVITAKHKALSVIALLHARIEIAVAVECQEEFLDKLKR